MMKAKDMTSEQSRDYDVFKDSLLRYLGYANEVGESFRVLVPVSVVHLSYIVASTYVCADSVDKGYKSWKDQTPSSTDRWKRALLACTDTLIWQGLASVIVPGFTINRVCWASRVVLHRASSLPLPVQKWTVVAVGLGSIPFIVSPIDSGVHYVMDRTFRKLYGHP